MGSLVQNEMNHWFKKHLWTYKDWEEDIKNKTDYVNINKQFKIEF